MINDSAIRREINHKL